MHQKIYTGITTNKSTKEIITNSFIFNRFQKLKIKLYKGNFYDAAHANFFIVSQNDARFDEKQEFFFLRA